MVNFSGNTMTIGSESVVGDGDLAILPDSYSGHMPNSLAMKDAGFNFDLRGMVDAGSPIKIVAIGSSATYGLLPTGGRAGAPWPAILQERLRDHYGVTNITVVNVGISGDNVQSLIDRFTTDVINNNPDLVIQLIGVNDTGRASYLDDLKTIAWMYRSNNINVIWSTTNPVFTTGTARKNFKLTIMNHQMKELARRLGIPVIDVYDGIVECTCRSRIWTIYDAMPDASDTHPSQDGYRLMGDLMAAGLMECYEVRNNDVITNPTDPMRAYPPSTTNYVSNKINFRQMTSTSRLSLPIMNYCGNSSFFANFLTYNGSGDFRFRVNNEVSSIYDTNNSSTRPASVIYDIQKHPGIFIVRVNPGDITSGTVYFNGASFFRYRAPRPYAIYRGDGNVTLSASGRLSTIDTVISSSWWSVLSGTYRGPYESVWLVTFSPRFSSMGRADPQVRSDTGAEIGPAVFVSAPGNTAYSNMSPGSQVTCLVEGSGFQVWVNNVNSSPIMYRTTSSVRVHEI